MLKTPLTASIEKQLVLKFSLPGVQWDGRSGTGGGSYQLEQFGEHWTMKISPHNAAETAQCLREVAATIDRFLAEEARARQEGR